MSNRTYLRFKLSVFAGLANVFGDDLLSADGDGVHFGRRVISDEMRSASERNLPDGPGIVVGKVSGQDADSQISAPVEVQESGGTIDVVEGSEASDSAVDIHGVKSRNASRRHEKPMGKSPANKDAFVA